MTHLSNPKSMSLAPQQLGVSKNTIPNPPYRYRRYRYENSHGITAAPHRYAEPLRKSALSGIGLLIPTVCGIAEPKAIQTPLSQPIKIKSQPKPQLPSSSRVTAAAVKQPAESHFPSFMEDVAASQSVVESSAASPATYGRDAVVAMDVELPRLPMPPPPASG
ncbi:hypothetical protein Tsubulata_035178 [Turnera subulata]|uniref:Uncharacterized protein n=1 Tax=Turnera subulata TaxID=218843 RepID=A0A9Q0F4J8_9ROSI|nr:hypothetical protein Tsubulata_035178 [Turnera subulata]